MPVRLAGREKTLYAIYQKMDEKHLSFAQVTDIYGFRVIVPSVTDCYTALGVLHQMYKPVPGKFKDHIAIPKLNGYQSLHTTLVGPSGVNIEFQMRTEEMHLVAEAGVAAHWLYKAQDADGAPPSAWAPSGCSPCWTSRTKRATPPSSGTTSRWTCSRRGVRVHAQEPDHGLAAGATVVDFAYAIHSNVGDHSRWPRINNEQVPLRTELKNGDVVEIITAPPPRPTPPGWALCARAARAPRSAPPEDTGADRICATWAKSCWPRRCAPKACRTAVPGRRPPADLGQAAALYRQPHPQRAADRHRPGQAHCQHRRQAPGGADDRTRPAPDALLLTRERYTAHETVSQGGVTLDGSENASVQYATCCRPVPGEPIVGYLGRGEGLVVHTAECAVASACSTRTASASSPWTGPTSPRALRGGIVVTARQRQGRAGAHGRQSGRCRGGHHPCGHGRRPWTPRTCASHCRARPAAPGNRAAQPAPHRSRAARGARHAPAMMRR
jgi:guanosine-3',5'-bis(diphosphate) 3'-pyrophosphohydrolase